MESDTEEKPYQKAVRLQSEGKSPKEIRDELMRGGLNWQDADFVLQSLPGGSMSGYQAPPAGAAGIHSDFTARPGQYEGDQAQTGGGSLPGWVWFVLVYGVGNAILYSTTGILLIPIPRK